MAWAVCARRLCYLGVPSIMECRIWAMGSSIGCSRCALQILQVMGPNRGKMAWGTCRNIPRIQVYNSHKGGSVLHQTQSQRLEQAGRNVLQLKLLEAAPMQKEMIPSDTWMGTWMTKLCYFPCLGKTSLASKTVKSFPVWQQKLSMQHACSGCVRCMQAFVRLDSCHSFGMLNNVNILQYFEALHFLVLAQKSCQCNTQYTVIVSQLTVL